VGRQPTDAVFHGNGARGTQLLLRPPEVEVLHGPLGQVLALGDGLGLQIALHHYGADAALAQLDGQAHAHGPTADDDHLGVLLLCHGLFLVAHCVHCFLLHSAVMPWALIRSDQRLASAATSFLKASGVLWAGVMPCVSKALATAGAASTSRSSVFSRST